MIANKNLSLKAIMMFAGHHLVWLTIWMYMITSLYYYTHWKWLAIPWVPISIIGTAVAFYLGFKNNQAYDRLWESRKIWGGIVNSSRMWASIVQSLLGKSDNQAAQNLIYRYIAWTYTLRQQLLVPTPWEHVSGWKNFGRFNQKRRERISNSIQPAIDAIPLAKYIQGIQASGENNFSNQAVYILDRQTQLLQALFEENKLDRIKQYELQKIINDCYEHQGKLERIKKFPLPRQYGSFSFIFVCIFVFLLPFGIIGEFGKLGDAWLWLAIPFGVIVSWIYIVMELIGDYSENPFEGLFNDVPMLSICRTIEIDLLSILGEENKPDPITAKGGILM